MMKKCIICGTVIDSPYDMCSICHISYVARLSVEKLKIIEALKMEQQPRISIQPADDCERKQIKTMMENT